MIAWFLLAVLVFVVLGAGILIGYVIRGAKDGPQLAEDIERTTARTRNVIDLTPHLKHLGVATGRTQRNRRIASNTKESK